MQRHYAVPHTRARAEIRLSEPCTRGWLLGLLRMLCGAYLRLALGCREVEVMDSELLVEAVGRALAGETRLIVAFRHPYVDEPQILSWLFLRGVDREARRLGRKLPRRGHAIFVYGYEVPRWGGALVRWLLPRLGALPVHHSRLDSAAIARILSAITDGDFPLALAPEGQVSYTSETVPRLESGTIRLGFEAADTIERAGRGERVLVLPLSVHRRYHGHKAIRALEKLTARIEAFVGLDGCDRVEREPRGGSRRGERAAGSPRLAAILNRLLDESEKLYGSNQPEVESAGADAPDDRDARLAALVESAVSTSERMLGITNGSGGIIERVYRVRHTGWDRIFVAGDPSALPPIERALADRLAGEAWYAMRHMELADFAWYFRTSPPAHDAPLDLLVEYVQNLWDFANRLAGGNISGRKTVRPYRTVIVPAAALDLTAALAQYRSGRKAAVAGVMDLLRAAYMRAIERARQ